MQLLIREFDSNKEYYLKLISSYPYTRLEKSAITWLVICLFVSLFTPFLANDIPLYAHINGKHFFPVIYPNENIFVDDKTNEHIFLKDVDWKNTTDCFLIWPVVTYSSNASDYANMDFVSPFDQQTKKSETDSILLLSLRHRHWMGTTQTGQDVFSGIIYGTRVSLGIGVVAVLLTGFIGCILGALGGYYGDKKIKIHLVSLLLIILGLIPSYFFSFYLRSEILIQSFQNAPIAFVFQSLLSVFIFVSLLFCLYKTGKLFSKIPFLQSKIYLPIDMILSRVTEVFSSLPRLVLIVTLSALLKPSVTNLILIIGLTSWTDIARIIRVEMIKIKDSDYIQAANLQGIPTFRLIFKHALPNIIQPVFVALILGISSVILIESSLSFLGIGVPFDNVTWGSLIADGRENFKAWWMVVFPGLAIFFTISSLHILAERLRTR